MTDLSKIKLNGTIYNFKDVGARNLIENLNSFEIEVVSSLPTSNIKDHTIYFVPQAVNSSTHDEYMYINNNWELIGTTNVDLSGYLQTTDIADWAKAANKPSYTASEVGAMSTSHAAAGITSTDILNWNNKADIFIITLTYDGENDTYTSDKTITEIANSAENNKLMFLRYEGVYYSYQGHNFEILDRWASYNFYNPYTGFDSNDIQIIGFYIRGDGAEIKPINRTQTTYSLSINANRITLTSSSGNTTYVDLPIYNGGVQ